MLLQSFNMKITAELQRKARLAHSSKKTAIFLTLTNQRESQFSAKIRRGCTDARHLTHGYLQTTLKNNQKAVN